MTAKEYLKQTDQIKNKIERLELELEQLKAMSTSIQAIQYGERIPSSNKNTESPFLRTIIKISDLEEQIKQANEKLAFLKLEISDAIDQLDNVDERLVLLARYINGKTWDEICIEQYRSESTIHRLHSAALHNFQVPK